MGPEPQPEPQQTEPASESGAAVSALPEPEPEAEPAAATASDGPPFPAVGDGLWVRSKGFPRWPALLVEADRYEPAEQKVLAKHPQYVVVKYFGTGERMAVDPKVRLARVLTKAIKLIVVRSSECASYSARPPRPVSLTWPKSIRVAANSRAASLPCALAPPLHRC